MKIEIKSLIEAYAKNKRDGLSKQQITENILSSMALPKYTVQNKHGTVTIFDSDTSECTYSIEGVWRTIQGWDEDILITFQNDETIQTHSLAMKKVLHSEGPFKKLMFHLVPVSPNRDRAVAISLEGKIVLFNLRSGDILGTLINKEVEFIDLYYDPNGEYIVAVARENVFILDSENLAYIGTIDYRGPIMNLNTSLDKHLVAINKKLYTIDNDGRKLVKLIISDEEIVDAMNSEESDEWYSLSRIDQSIRFSPDSRYLVMVSKLSKDTFLSDGRFFFSPYSKIFVFDANSLKEICILDRISASFSEGYVEAAFSPDGQYIVGRDGEQIKIWKSGTWELCAVLLIKNSGMGFSQDGKYLLIDP